VTSISKASMSRNTQEVGPVIDGKMKVSENIITCHFFWPTTRLGPPYQLPESNKAKFGFV
jgi:hypothetical protein